MLPLLFLFSFLFPNRFLFTQPPLIVSFPIIFSSFSCQIVSPPQIQLLNFSLNFHVFTDQLRLCVDNIHVNQLINNLNKFNMSNKLNKLTTKRFVIRQSLIGTNTVITFVTKKGKTITYNHDDVYTRNKERFDSMNCFIKYKSYTNSNNIPTFCR